MNNFITRSITSIFFGSTFLTLIYINNFFYLLIVILFILGLYEVLKIKNFFIKIIILVIFAIFLTTFYNLRFKPDGLFLIVWGLATTWMTDSSAYLFGKAFGKKKINFISPNKTYVGYISGFLVPQSTYFLITIFINHKIFLNLKDIIIIQACISTCVLIGDLIFSYFKRELKMKDYSNILPGHGGLFDRIDGLIFAIFFLYLYF